MSQECDAAKLAATLGSIEKNEDVSPGGHKTEIPTIQTADSSGEHSPDHSANNFLTR